MNLFNMEYLQRGIDLPYWGNQLAVHQALELIDMVGDETHIRYDDGDNKGEYKSLNDMRDTYNMLKIMNSTYIRKLITATRYDDEYLENYRKQVATKIARNVELEEEVVKLQATINDLAGRLGYEVVK